MTVSNLAVLLCLAAMLLVNPDLELSDPSPDTDAADFNHVNKRRLSHKCGWKDYLCCYYDLSHCRFCTDICIPGNFIYGIFNVPCGLGGSNDCKSEPGTPGAFSCVLGFTGQSSYSFTKQRGQGSSVTLLTYNGLF